MKIKYIRCVFIIIRARFVQICIGFNQNLAKAERVRIWKSTYVALLRNVMASVMLYYIPEDLCHKVYVCLSRRGSALSKTRYVCEMDRIVERTVNQCIRKVSLSI